MIQIFRYIFKENDYENYIKIMHESLMEKVNKIVYLYTDDSFNTQIILDNYRDIWHGDGAIIKYYSGLKDFEIDSVRKYPSFKYNREVDIIIYDMRGIDGMTFIFRQIFYGIYTYLGQYVSRRGNIPNVYFILDRGAENYELWTSTAQELCKKHVLMIYKEDIVVKF